VAEDEGALARRDPVMREVRKLGARQLRAMGSDGKERMLGWKPDVGNKWSRLSKLLGEIEWDWIEALDEKGGVLGRINRPLDEEEDEEIQDAAGWSPAEIADVLTRFAREMRQADRQSFDSQLDGFAKQLEGAGAVVTAMSEGLRSVVESFNTALKVQAASTAASAMGADEGSAEVKAMLGAALQLMMSSPRSPVIDTGGSK